MVDDPVPERRGGDQAALGFMDIKAGIGSRAVGESAQLILELEKLVFKPVFKLGHIRLATFPLLALRYARGRLSQE